MARADRVINERNGSEVLSRLSTAEGRWGAFKGLMFDASLPADQGLLFAPARGIHTQFMRFPIDLIFLDEANRVVQIREAMQPWRLDFSRAASVIEANAGTAQRAGLAVGDQLRYEPGVA